MMVLVGEALAGRLGQQVLPLQPQGGRWSQTTACLRKHSPFLLQPKYPKRDAAGTVTNFSKS